VIREAPLFQTIECVNRSGKHNIHLAILELPPPTHVRAHTHTRAHERDVHAYVAFKQTHWHNKFW